MKTKTKAFLLVLCAMVLVFASVLGTMAYLTSTDKVTNTFTVGSVEIELDEAKVDLYGNPVDGADRVDANNYKLIPGHIYTKDPTVKIKGGSEQAYVRMFVKVENYSQLTNTFSKPDADAASIYYGADGVFNIGALVNGTHNNTIWEFEKFVETNSTYEFRYHEVVDARDTSKDAYMSLEPLFKEIKVPEFLNNEEIAKLEGVKFTITAHAIQADGFTTADAAWTAFGTQNQQ